MARFYGDRMSYIMERPEGSPNVVCTISKNGQTSLDANGYPEGNVKIEPYKQPNHWEKLPGAAASAERARRVAHLHHA